MLKQYVLREEKKFLFIFSKFNDNFQWKIFLNQFNKKSSFYIFLFLNWKLDF